MPPTLHPDWMSVPYHCPTPGCEARKLRLPEASIPVCDNHMQSDPEEDGQLIPLPVPMEPVGFRVAFGTRLLS